MSVQIYHNPRCSKSRQTLQLLEDNQQDIEIIEYLKTPPSIDQLREVIKLLNISPRQLLRKGEAEYKTAGLGNAELDDEAVLQAMVDYPKLIERPIVIKNGQACIGRPPELILDIL